MFKKLKRFIELATEDNDPKRVQEENATTASGDAAPSSVAEAPPESPVKEDADVQAEDAATDSSALTYIESASPNSAESGEPIDPEVVKNRVVDMMKTIFDPEIPVNIYDIGLIYKIEPKEDGMVELVMTLTTPNCPAAGILPGEVESKARSVEGVRDVEFELTFDPPWNPDMMSEGARLELGMM